MNREDFLMIDTNYIYFDNGATTWKPKCVVDSIVDYYTKYTANAHRGDYDFSLRVDNAYEGAREIVRDFINANSFKEIVFTSGTTNGMNIIVNNYFKKVLKKDDEVIISYHEHASNVLPWFNLANEIGIKIKYYDNIDSLNDLINEHTKVISLAMITNVLGSVRPIKEIVKIAHEKNILVVVDGAQSVPHIKTDVKDLDCDFLVFSGHKMYGPTGIGVLYGKESLISDITPPNLGGGMNESFDNENDIYYKDIPTRLEGGTPNISGAIGLGSAIKYIESIGIDNIHKHEVDLKNYAVSKLKDIPHVILYNEDNDSGIIALNIKDVFAQDVAIYLNKYHVCVRAGNHCAKLLKNVIGTNNTLRISFGIYNTKEEVDTLVELLSDRDKIIKEMLDV